MGAWVWMGECGRVCGWVNMCVCVDGGVCGWGCVWMGECVRVCGVSDAAACVNVLD